MPDDLPPITQAEGARPMTCNAGHTNMVALWDCPDPSHEDAKRHKLGDFFEARTPRPGGTPIAHIFGRCIPVREGLVATFEAFRWVCPPDCPVDARGFE